MIELIFATGLTLGVGASTFALIFYIRSLEDGQVDSSERRFMHTVYVVLRIGMALIFIGLLGGVLTEGFTSLQENVYLWVLLLIITVNAVLMTYRLMPMRYGPVLAGASWHTLFLFTRFLESISHPLLALLVYGGLCILYYVLFHALKNRYTIVKGIYGGDVLEDAETLEQYSRDASAFKISPIAVYYPRNVRDVLALVSLAREKRHQNVNTSLTMRAGGTCMSGGPLNSGWIVDMTRHMHHIEVDPKNRTATVEMGAYFRDLEDKAAKYGLMFPAYPSSHRICGVGGMIGNNASGEKSLRYGATSDNVLSLDVVLANGRATTIKPRRFSEVTDPRELAVKSLAELYGDRLRKATGEVKKSASGYRLEKVISDGMCNLIPLFVGSQGTLGIVTRAVLRLVPIPKHLSLLVISGNKLEDIPVILDEIFAWNPEALETFDLNTFTEARKHLKQHADRMIPYIDPAAHLFILAEFSEETEEATEARANGCYEALRQKGFTVHTVVSPDDRASAWEVRRNAFLLMRDYNPLGKKAIPCIEDVIVPIPMLGTFIRELHHILERRGIYYGFHGHIGDGSLRIIPIFDTKKATAGDEITELMTEVFALVKRLHGNISADHSDGIVRSPFLKEFYGEELFHVFEEVKRIYDPENIMNPGKKVGCSVDGINTCLDCA